MEREYIIRNESAEAYRYIGELTLERGVGYNLLGPQSIKADRILL